MIEKPRTITNREWGTYQDHIRTDTFVVKTLVFRDEERTSWQMHRQRGEFWVVDSGTGFAVIQYPDEDIEVITLEPGVILLVPEGIWHCIHCTRDLVVHETQFGSACREDDTTRATHPLADLMV